MKIKNRYCFSIDLKPDEQLIKEYEAHHKAVWPEVIISLKQAGVQQLEIYRSGIKLFMIMDVSESFSFARKNKIDKSNPIIKEWENLMSTYQQAIPGSIAGEKWTLMKQLFKLQ